VESTVLTLKFVLFLAMEVFVVATLGAVLILAMYGYVKSKVAESGALRGAMLDIKAANSPGVPVGHKS
jgi:hypothetical protein